MRRTAERGVAPHARRAAIGIGFAKRSSSEGRTSTNRKALVDRKVLATHPGDFRAHVLRPCEPLLDAQTCLALRHPNSSLDNGRVKLPPVGVPERRPRTALFGGLSAPR